MEVNRLLSEELSYELFIRGLPTTGTVENKRTLLRDVFRLERLGEKRPPVLVDLDPVSELCTCRAKLNALSHSVNHFDHDNRDNDYKRIHTRLLHLNFRLNRIDARDQVDISLKHELLQSCIQLLTDLGATYGRSRVIPESRCSPPGNPTQSNPSVKPVRLVDDLISFEDGDAHPRASSSTIQPVLSEQPAVPEARKRVVPPSMNTLSTDPSEPTASVNRRGLLHPQALFELADNNFEHQREAIPITTQPNIRSDVTSLGRGNLQHTDNLPSTNGGEAIPAQSQLVDTYPQTRRQSQVTFSSPIVSHFTPPFNKGQHPVNLPTEADDLSSRPPPENTRTSTQAMRLSMSDPFVDLADRLDNFQFSSLRGPSNGNNCPSIDTTPRYFDVSRWNLHFDGNGSVNDFLDRVEELRTSRGVSKAQLLRAAPELLTKDALLWFRTGHFASWDELVTKLRNDFQPYDYEFMLWDEIRRRTQGSQERVVNFVSIMENLFRKLPSIPSEASRVQLIKRNLLPCIQSRLATVPINSLTELLQYGRAVEETEARVQRFVPPPTNYRHLLEPSLAYHKPSSNPFVTVVDHVKETPQSESLLDTPVPQVDVVTSKTPSICWNCKQSGHRFRQCSKPRRKFCFKCGRDNVASWECVCSKNGIPGTRS